MGKNNKGFTLVELLIVLAIIGIMAAIGSVYYPEQLKKGRDSQRKTYLTQMKSALEMYRSDNGVYPSSGGSWRGNCSIYGGYPVSGATGYIPNLAPQYIETLPIDPKSSSGCCYLYNSNGADYKLLAHCTPESATAYSNPNDEFYDSTRPTWSWQVHSGQNSAGW